MSNIVPGSELTKEPFRWDQRLFGLVLRMPATPMLEVAPNYIPSAEDSPIDAMCEVTGGKIMALCCLFTEMSTHSRSDFSGWSPICPRPPLSCPKAEVLKSIFFMAVSAWVCSEPWTAIEKIVVRFSWDWSTEIGHADQMVWQV